MKVYEKSKLSTSKLRAVKREAAMMIYMTRKRCPPSINHQLFHSFLSDAVAHPVPGRGVSPSEPASYGCITWVCLSPGSL